MPEFIEILREPSKARVSVCCRPRGHYGNTIAGVIYREIRIATSVDTGFRVKIRITIYPY